MFEKFWRYYTAVAFNSNKCKSFTNRIDQVVHATQPGRLKSIDTNY